MCTCTQTCRSFSVLWFYFLGCGYGVFVTEAWIVHVKLYLVVCMDVGMHIFKSCVSLV